MSVPAYAQSSRGIVVENITRSDFPCQGTIDASTIYTSLCHQPSTAMQFVDQLNRVGVRRADQTKAFLHHPRKRTKIAARIGMPRRLDWARAGGLYPCVPQPHHKIELRFVAGKIPLLVWRIKNYLPGWA
jgi:hypothetical protein